MVSRHSKCSEVGCHARHRSNTGLCIEHRPPVTVVANRDTIQVGGMFVLDPAAAVDLANRLVDAAEGMAS
ncbi:hypothetical protein ACIBM3_22980 [Rhodococcus erythropolis]|uniref:hypothetical protein n=1 Tax=Rhodococcus erythropolis TaxID=1833 RepID=UPI0037B86246